MFGRLTQTDMTIIVRIGFGLCGSERGVVFGQRCSKGFTGHYGEAYTSWASQRRDVIRSGRYLDEVPNLRLKGEFRDVREAA